MILFRFERGQIKVWTLLKLSTKLIALILICTFGMVLIGAFGDYQMKIVNNSVEKCILSLCKA